MQTEPETLSFGRFTLDIRRRTLVSGATPVSLHARAFDILVYLIQHRERPVSHAEITVHVWSGRIVSDNNLSVQLSTLRKALAEAGEGTPLILTLPERHYRFVGELSVIEPDGVAPEQHLVTAAEPFAAVAQSPKKRIRAISMWTLAGAGGALLILCAVLLRPGSPAKTEAHRLSLVVLPFHNVSPDRAQDYLADGITDDLSADLAQIPASIVIARESAEAVKHETPQRIGTALGVRYIVSGSMDPEEDRYHVLVTLIEAATGRALWTTQFDPPREHVSDVRPAIVRRIATTLNVAIDALEAAGVPDSRQESPDAVDLLFRARSILDSGQTLKAFEAAHGLLRQAIARQTDFADAQAELGWMLLRKVTTLSDPDEAADLIEAHTAIQTALAASPQNSRAIAAHAMEQYNKGDCNGAQQNATRALSLEPSSLSARTVLAACAQMEMRFDDAVHEYEGILALNPASPHNAVFYLIVGTLRLVQGNVAEADKYLSLAKDDDATPSADLEPAEQAELFLIAVRNLSGEQAKARADYQRYAKKFPDRTVWRIASYFHASWLKMNGLKKALKALEDAGMPAYADEDSPGTQAITSCVDGAFAPTPGSLPAGGRVINTVDFIRTAAMPKTPLVVDLGQGRATEPGWALYKEANIGETPAAFALRMASERAGGKPASPIVILGEGVTGCAAFLAARALIEAGYTDIEWYRGGEEAWARHKG